MNRNNFWKFVLVALVVLWSLYELNPPKSRELVQYFRERAVGKDVTFSNIVVQAQALQKSFPERSYDNLIQAIGTNDLLRYFPFLKPRTRSIRLPTFSTAFSARPRAESAWASTSRAALLSWSKWTPAPSPTPRMPGRL